MRDLVPPRELLDPDGEGIYLYDDRGFPPLLMRAALIFFGNLGRWRDVEVEDRYMRPGPDGEEWFPANIGRWPRGWRLNLPRRWAPVRYAYCCPKPETMPDV